jgi:transposase InsO family protein
MGWKETCAMDERMRFVMAAKEGDESFAAVCRRFGVSRKTGYKWQDRYASEGVGGLGERSRAPLHHPQAVPARIVERCLEMRRKHPTWGPVKVRGYLERRAPATPWPAVSTIGALFDREGLTVQRKFRRRSPPSSAPFAACGGPNDVWCIDFKGWFLTGNGTRCEPLTLSDAHSRYLLRCQALGRTDVTHVWPVLDAALREFGLPRALRSDNGPPFASRGAGGLSQLSVKVIKAGVLPERITPGKPQENGRLERLHLTLLQDTADPPAHSLRQQVERLQAFQQIYNEERPHAALGNDTPAMHYATSLRRFDGVLRQPEYGPDHLIRRVRQSGEIKWQGHKVHISTALIGEPVGLVEDESGSWSVVYGPVELGIITHRGDRLRQPQTIAPVARLNKTRNVLPMSSV